MRWRGLMQQREELCGARRRMRILRRFHSVPRIESMVIKFKVNGKDRSVDVPPNMPLLWVIRETLGLTGTKYGCGEALCGACTVHLDGEAVRSCSTAVSDAAGKSVTTIE